MDSNLQSNTQNIKFSLWSVSVNSEGLCFLTSLMNNEGEMAGGELGRVDQIVSLDPKRMTIHVGLYPHNRRLWGRFKGMSVLSWLLDHSLVSIMYGGPCGTPWPSVAVQLPILLWGTERQELLTGRNVLEKMICCLKCFRLPSEPW